jgi:hypothetical protein
MDNSTLQSVCAEEGTYYILQPIELLQDKEQLKAAAGSVGG